MSARRMSPRVTVDGADLGRVDEAEPPFELENLRVAVDLHLEGLVEELAEPLRFVLVVQVLASLCFGGRDFAAGRSELDAHDLAARVALLLQPVAVHGPRIQVLGVGEDGLFQLGGRPRRCGACPQVGSTSALGWPLGLVRGRHTGARDCLWLGDRELVQRPIFELCRAVGLGVGFRVEAVAREVPGRSDHDHCAVQDEDPPLARPAGFPASGAAPGGGVRLLFLPLGVQRREAIRKPSGDQLLGEPLCRRGVLARLRIESAIGSARRHDQQLVVGNADLPRLVVLDELAHRAVVAETAVRNKRGPAVATGRCCIGGAAENQGRRDRSWPV